MLNSISDLIYSQKIELKKLWKNKRTLLLQVRQSQARHATHKRNK